MIMKCTGVETPPGSSSQLLWPDSHWLRGSRHETLFRQFRSMVETADTFRKLAHAGVTGNRSSGGPLAVPRSRRGPYSCSLVA